MDWTAINAAVDFSDSLAFLAVAATAVVGFLVALKGYHLAKAALGR